MTTPLLQTITTARRYALYATGTSSELSDDQVAFATLEVRRALGFANRRRLTPKQLATAALVHATNLFRETGLAGWNIGMVGNWSHERVQREAAAFADALTLVYARHEKQETAWAQRQAAKPKPVEVAGRFAGSGHMMVFLDTDVAHVSITLRDGRVIGPATWSELEKLARAKAAQQPE